MPANPMKTDSAPRIANVLLGLWLLASTFFWDHTASQRANLWEVGALSVAFAMFGLSLFPMAPTQPPPSMPQKTT